MLKACTAAMKTTVEISGFIFPRTKLTNALDNDQLLTHSQADLT